MDNFDLDAYITEAVKPCRENEVAVGARTGTVPSR